MHRTPSGSVLRCSGRGSEGNAESGGRGHGARQRAIRARPTCGSGADGSPRDRTRGGGPFAARSRAPSPRSARHRTADSPPAPDPADRFRHDGVSSARLRPFRLLAGRRGRAGEAGPKPAATRSGRLGSPPVPDDLCRAALEPPPPTSRGGKTAPPSRPGVPDRAALADVLARLRDHPLGDGGKAHGLDQPVDPGPSGSPPRASARAAAPSRAARRAHGRGRRRAGGRSDAPSVASGASRSTAGAAPRRPTPCPRPPRRSRSAPASTRGSWRELGARP